MVTVRLNPNPVLPLKLLASVFAGLDQKVWDNRLGSAQGTLGGLSPRRRRLIAMHWRTVGPEHGIAYEKPR